ncbi:hypothetical protein EVAR_7214_1 [Eumeta japonica]|uniref:Uncharacterized protein n=1 Tax=Eumeta variegata TaxID=151549 RepID=A0A4C1T5Q4_EUMVA|nr:hypothetical protein EVAR_7214_1 [Eumeta japonica]
MRVLTFLVIATLIVTASYCKLHLLALRRARHRASDPDIVTRIASEATVLNSPQVALGQRGGPKVWLNPRNSVYYTKGNWCRTGHRWNSPHT